MPTEQKDMATLASHQAFDVMQWGTDLRECLIFLSRLPVSRSNGSHGPALAKAMRAFSLAGLVIGFVSALALGLALWVGFNPTIASLLACAVGTAVTGALHEDGLADVADGFGGGTTVERKLEIMRDSHIGAYGVLALVLGVAIKVFALAAVIAASAPIASMLIIVAVAVVSRCFMGVMMHALPNARTDGRSAAAGRPSRDTIQQLVLSGLVIAIPLMWLAAGFWSSIAALIFAAAAFAGMKTLAEKQIGGQTGDVLGATQQLTEITLLLVFAASLS